LLTSAFEQIRLYSQADLAVSLRLLRALIDIAGTAADPAYRANSMRWEHGLSLAAPNN